MKQNRINNVIALLGLVLEKTNGNQTIYSTQSILLNPNTLEIPFARAIPSPVLEKKFTEGRSKEIKPFTGIPQAFYVNHDGTYTILYQAMSYLNSNKLNYTNLGSIGVSL